MYSLSPTLSLSHSLFLSLFLSHTHTQLHSRTHAHTHTHTHTPTHPDTKGCSVRPQCHSAHSLELAGSFHAEWDDGVAGERGFRFLGESVDGEALTFAE